MPAGKNIKTYIVSHLGQELGPYSEAELKNLWDKKEILPVDYLFDETKQDWYLITEVFDWAQFLTSTSITTIKDRNRMEDEGPPSLNKVERTKITPKVMAKEDPPPPEVILRRPKNIPYTTQFKSGQAKIDLSELSKTPGTFSIKEAPGSSLKFKEAFQIEVRPAIPKKLMVRVPFTIQAGQTIDVKIDAVDEGHHFCPNLNGFVELSIRCETFTRVERVQIIYGLGHFAFQHTRAEKISFEITNLRELVDQETLRLETEPACHLQILPGPAMHMSVIGPAEFTVGQDIQLELQAVDQFGNFVQSFNAKIEVEANKSAANATATKNRVS